MMTFFYGRGNTNKVILLLPEYRITRSHQLEMLNRSIYIDNIFEANRD